MLVTASSPLTLADLLSADPLPDFGPSFPPELLAARFGRFGRWPSLRFGTH